MDKNIIKNHLSKRFLSEETTPGIAIAKKINGENGKINKDGVKAVEKDSLDYNEDLKQDKDTSKMATNKYTYTNDAEKTYHDEMEILNGQEMIKYASEPGKEFSQRAKEGIEGSSRMGNKGGKGMGNAEEAWGASSDDFGKKLVDRIKGSEKKRAIADAPIDSLTSLGDKIAYPNDKVSVTPDKTAMSGGAGKNNKGDTTPQTKSAVTKTNIKTVQENNNNNSQIKESMKRLKFNKNGDKPFKGSNLTQKLGHALTLIPEGYKVNSKEFEMTDGNVTCKVRWEGNLNEGKAIVLQAADKTMISEDMNRMKALMGYKSQDTLGLVKGNARIDENAAFADVWKKTRKLLEGEDIEDAEVKDGSAESLDDAVSQAPEAKKHIEGSVSTDKGTQAPAPKKGNWEENVKGQAAEAKKHIEGTTSDDKGTQAPAPKEGNWEEIKKKSPEAKKDIESGKPTSMATDKAKVVDTAKVVKENEEVGGGEEDNDVDVKDDYFKNDDDDSAEEKEPTANDIKGDVPSTTPTDDDDTAVVPPAPKGGPKLMVSQSSGEHYLLQNGKHLLKDEQGNPIPVPAEYVELAKKNPKLALTKIQDEAEFGDKGGEEELDEAVSPEAEANAERQFDELNAKLGGKETKNKMQWMQRAKDNNYQGTFKLQKGRNGIFIVFDAKNFMPSTGGSSSFGTANEGKK